MEKQFIDLLELYYRKCYLEHMISLDKTLEGKVFKDEDWEEELRIVDEYIESRYN